MSKIDSQWLIEQIRQEFRTVLLGDGISLHQTEVIDSHYGRDAKLMAEAKAQDKDIRWWDIPIDVIEKTCWGWSFFDTKGFVYYLPAFMTYYLKYNHREYSDTALEPVLYSLQADDFYKPFHQALNQEQSKLVAMFLWYYCELNNWEVMDCNEAQQALLDHWDQFLGWCDGGKCFPEAK